MRKVLRGCAIATLIAGGLLWLGANAGQVPIAPMSFEQAAKRHQELIAEYRENTTKIEQLTERNQQILTELNYMSGYLDAIDYLSLPSDLGEGEVRELVRLAYGPLAGVVEDDLGTPISGARVTLFGGDRQSTYEVFSGADGTFRLEDLVPLDGAPLAHHDDFAFLRSDRLEASPDGGWKPVRIVMSETATLIVKVLQGFPHRTLRRNNL